MPRVFRNPFVVAQLAEKSGQALIPGPIQTKRTENYSKLCLQIGNYPCFSKGATFAVWQLFNLFLSQSEITLLCDRYFYQQVNLQH